jgi:hypothetical protein
LQQPGALDVVPTVDGTQLLLRYGLGGTRSESPFVAIAVPVAQVGEFDRLRFSARASRPTRVSVQIRIPGEPSSLRWQRSVYLDETARDVDVPFDEMRPIGPAPDVRQAERDLELAAAGRDLAADEHARLAEQVAALATRKEQTEADLARLNADVRHQDSVFATLEVLKKEQGFLRELIGSMVDEGSVAHDRVRELRQESEALVAQQLDLEKELIGKQAEIDVLEKAIMTKSQGLDSEPGVSNARAF